MDELDFIVSSYAQLRFHGSPLKNININHSSPTKPRSSPSKQRPPPMQHPETPSEIYRLCTSAIELALNRMPTVSSLDSSYLHLASACFAQLYITDIPSKRTEVAKRHQSFILKIIDLESRLRGDYSFSIREIRSAMFKCKGGDNDILNAPSTSSTSTVLKLFMLQVIYKMFQKQNFVHADNVLLFFMKDSPSFIESQKTSILKLLLSLGRIAPSDQFKVCMNLKFLQYIKSFNMKFESFITNLSFEGFVADLEFTVLSLKKFDKVSDYLFEFLLTDHSDTFTNAVEYVMTYSSSNHVDWQLVIPDSTRSNAIIKLLKVGNINPTLIESELACLKRPTQQLLDSLGQYILKSLPSYDISNLLMFYVDHTYSLTKTCHGVLDKTIMNAKKLKCSREFFETYFSRLWNLYSHTGDQKRLRNLSNISFNLRLYSLSMIIERELFLKNQCTSDLPIKYLKALHLLNGEPIGLSKIMAIIFDNSFLTKLSPHLLLRFDLLDQKFGSRLVFSQLSLLPISDLSQENRSLVFALATKYGTGADLVKFFDRLEIQDPILQLFCGTHCTELPTFKMNRISTIITTNADPLIKCFYYFSLEFKLRSIVNIEKILNLYLNSWIPRNRYPLTSFEAMFIKSLVAYLKFINFQKSLKKLLTSIEGYSDLNKISGLAKWFILEKLENALNLKDILKLSVDELDVKPEDIGATDKAEFIMKALPFMLLKLKYYSINFDQDKLTDVAIEIYDCIDASPDVLSIDNKSGLSRDKFLESLMLLVNLMYSRSKFLWIKGQHMESVTSAVASIQLSKSILKSEPGNLQIIQYMGSGFRNVINTLIHLGLSKDADYYIGEFGKFNESVSKFKIIHVQNCYFIAHFYHVTGRVDDCHKIKRRGDDIFKSLNLIRDGDADKYVDNYKLIYHRHLSDIYSSNDRVVVDAKANLKSFLTFMEKEGKVLAHTWRLNYEYHFNSEIVDLTINKSKNPYLNAMNYMLNSRRLFINAQSSLNMDPLYSTMEDSAMAIPSVVKMIENVPTPQTPQKARSNSVKNVKKSIIGMRQSKGMVLQLLSELRYLANYQRNEIHRVLSLNLLTLSSISNTYDGMESVRECVLLNNHVKTRPFLNEKAMITITSRTGKSLPDFNLTNLLATTSVEFEKPDMSVIRNRNWQVVSIDVSSINDELIISRLDDTPKMLKLPLTRLFVRNGEDINFKLKDCLVELKRIIEESDKTLAVEVTSSIKTPEGRKQWHDTRTVLDEQLRNLLLKIEHYWIGGFKGIFSPVQFKKDDVAIFKRKFLNIIRMNVPTRSHKNHGHAASKSVEIDDFVVELFLRLGDPRTLSTTDPLEDLIYFVLDILLFHGEENAYDEVDIDNIYVQTESLLGEHFALNSEPGMYSHTVLVLGKELHGIPWENIPCLRRQSISRVPSVSLAVDILDRLPSLSASKTGGSFIINPAGDLKKTEERFADCLQDLRNILHWGGSCGDKPTEDQFKDALQSSLFLYVGHGSGTSYIRETTIKNLPEIAPSLLLGCSSAALIDNNLLEPSGTVLSYLIGGCPMVVGNLWDVTDKDIDKFTLSMFKTWGLNSETAESDWKPTICDAVRLSRDECKLKYLNGAAPVVYGLPLTLQ